MIVRPEWYYRTTLVSWRVWAVGFYSARRKNWAVSYFALGPFRFQFVRLLTKRNTP